MILLICINANASRQVLEVLFYHCGGNPDDPRYAVIRHVRFKKICKWFERMYRYLKWLPPPSLLFPSPKFEKSSRNLKSSSDPSFIDMPYFDIGETLVTWWDRETSFKHIPSASSFGKVTLFFFLCTPFIKTGFWWYSFTFSCVVVLCSDKRYVEGLTVIFEFSVDLTLADFQGRIWFILFLCFVVKSIQSNRGIASNRVLYWD